MRRILLPASFLIAVTVGALSACPSGTEAAELCGMQECPVGTLFHETRTSMMTYDIDAGFNAMTYDAEGSFKSFGSGSCEYYCSVIQPCPDGTFPVISENCFTCGAVTYDNGGDPVVSQGDCGAASQVDGTTGD